MGTNNRIKRAVFFTHNSLFNKFCCYGQTGVIKKEKNNSKDSVWWKPDGSKYWSEYPKFCFWTDEMGYSNL